MNSVSFFGSSGTDSKKLTFLEVDLMGKGSTFY